MRREVVLAAVCSVMAVATMLLGVYCTPPLEPKTGPDATWKQGTVSPGFDAGNGALK